MQGGEPSIKQEKGLQGRSDGDDEEEELISPPPEETDGAQHRGKSLLELADLDVLEASVARDTRKAAAAAALKRRQEEERELATDGSRRYYADGRAAGWDIGLFEGGSVLYAFTKTSGATTAGLEEDEDEVEEEGKRISPVLEEEEEGRPVKAAAVEAEEGSQEMRVAGKRKRTPRASARLLESEDEDEEEVGRGSRLFLASNGEDEEEAGEDDFIMDLLDAEEEE